VEAESGGAKEEQGEVEAQGGEEAAKLLLEAPPPDDAARSERGSKTSKEGSKTQGSTAAGATPRVQEEEGQDQPPPEPRWVWTGPEEDPRWLDVFVWKPLSLVGPTAVKNAGATTTVENMRMGRSKALPEDLVPKRSYMRQETYKDAVSGTAKTVKYNPNVLFESNVHTTDWLTGATIYKYDQNQMTVTNSLGHGALDKQELSRRKTVKVKSLEKNIGELQKRILAQQKIVKQAEDKTLAKKMTAGAGRTKVKGAEEIITKLEVEQKQLQIRLNQEEREIKAIQHGSSISFYPSSSLSRFIHSYTHTLIDPYIVW
jgi:hypothetical protein